MKQLIFALLMVPMLALNSCSSFKGPGKEVKGPFSGSSYQTSGRFFRGTGYGVSRSQEVARDKARMMAQKELAGSVSTTMKAVSDRFLNERTKEQASDINEKFETLNREVLNQSITDVRTLGEKTYQLEDGTFKVYIALEASKKAIYQRMKEQAEARKNLDEKTKADLVKMLQQALEQAETD